ncbi:hypothetical protein TIFTF001_032010 [Ficus carica]|uniref:Uncharacterized protein n=1 Tax=Ficus carica TaxID=3494 RepID=A0AA88J5Z0_FICCA|nr:hypothetical protein TIFTF001_032010 [Ficus carica]
MEIVPPSSEPLDLDTIRSRARELENILRNLEDDDSELSRSDLQKLAKDCVHNFQTRMEEIGSLWSDVGFSEDKDFEPTVTPLGLSQRVGEELNFVEAENTRMSGEIEVLTRTYAEDSKQLEIELEGLKCSMDLTALQDLEKVNLGASRDCPRHTEDKWDSMEVCGDKKLELLELGNELKKKTAILKSLEDLDVTCKWFDAIEQIQDAFTGVKVIALEENCIRFSLQTYIPQLESVFSEQKIEAVNVPIEVRHEVLIEFLEGTLDQKNVESIKEHKEKNHKKNEKNAAANNGGFLNEEQPNDNRYFF